MGAGFTVVADGSAATSTMLSVEEGRANGYRCHIGDGDSCLTFIRRREYLKLLVFAALFGALIVTVLLVNR